MGADGIAVLGDIVRRNAARHAGKTAFVDRSGAISFATFNRRVNRLTDAFGRAGAVPGDRVAILSRNRTEYVEVIAVNKSGLVAVPLNWRLAAPERLAVLRDCDPVAIVAEEEFLAELDLARPLLPGVTQWLVLGPARTGWASYQDLIATGSDAEPAHRPAPGDIACITYTSGTTGAPKGVELTHRALIENGRDAAAAMQLDQGDVSLAMMPFFHVGGLWYHLQPGFAAGCTTIILPGFNVADVLAAMARHGVTVTHLVPTMLADLLADPAAAEASATLRLIFYAAAPIPAELLRRSMRVLSHCGFLQSYGSTEAGMVTELTPADHRRALADPAEAPVLLSCGKALGRVEIRIDGADGDDEAIGEIMVRGPKTMAGYRGQPALAADAWLPTGDIGRRDSRGYLTILDRKNDMVISGGENIYPSEVEHVLLAHPDVAQAAAFGVPDPRWGDRLVSAVVLRPDARVSPDDLRAHIRSRLAAYKCPKSIFIVDALPYSAAGKLLRTALRQRYSRPEAAAHV